jgi:hypothetical protein
MQWRMVYIPLCYLKSTQWKMEIEDSGGVKQIFWLNAFVWGKAVPKSSFWGNSAKSLECDNWLPSSKYSL